MKSPVLFKLFITGYFSLMKNLCFILFSLMLMVSINAVGATGTSHEGKINSEVLQTHDCLTFDVLTVNSFESIEAEILFQNYNQSFMVNPPGINLMQKNDLFQNQITNTRQTLVNEDNSQSLIYSFIDPGRNDLLSLIDNAKRLNTNKIRDVSFT